MAGVYAGGTTTIVPLIPTDVDGWTRSKEELGSDGYAAVFGVAGTPSTKYTGEWVIKFVKDMKPISEILRKLKKGATESRTDEYDNLVVECEAYADLDKSPDSGILFPKSAGVGCRETKGVGGVPMHYTVVQKIRGDNLGKWFDRRRASWPGGRMPLSLVYSIGLSALDALQSLHSSGWVHRDLKPMNMMIQAKEGDVYRDDFVPRVVLIDFGTALRLSDTQTHAHAGTPLYTSYASKVDPKPSDPMDDLESIGYVLASFVLGGRLPWQNVAGDIYEMAEMVGAWNPDVDLSLDASSLALYLKYARSNNIHRNFITGETSNMMGERSALEKRSPEQMSWHYAMLRGLLRSGLNVAGGVFPVSNISTRPVRNVASIGTVAVPIHISPDHRIVYSSDPRKLVMAKDKIWLM